MESVCVSPEGDRVAENMMAAHSEKHRADTADTALLAPNPATP